ncbi:MAG: hypothetical protein GC136_03045 [Alphaproteobacteria bacterium]|nr:hypothetical protein [Alphaproteobacteria bacterium]
MLTIHGLVMKMSSGRIDGLFFTGAFNLVAAIVLLGGYFIAKAYGLAAPVKLDASLAIFIIILGLSVGGYDFFLFNMFKAGAPLSISLPLVYTLIFVLTVTAGLLFFKDKLALHHIIGLILGAASIFLLNK